MAELLGFTAPLVLRNEAEYTAAVAEIDQLLDIDPPPRSEAYESLEFLSSPGKPPNSSMESTRLTARRSALAVGQTGYE
jgi:hypothetical protein